MKYSYKYILESLPKKKNANSSWWVKLLIRKLSFPFTYLFINLGFSANAVSVLSVLTVIAGCICYCLPGTAALVAAIILTNFWLLLDCVDGNIARCKKQKTVFGEFVDDIGGYYIESLVYLAIGICVYNYGGVLFPAQNHWIVVIGAVSSIVNVLARLIHKDYGHFAIHADKSVQETHTVDDRGSLYYIRQRVSKEFGISGMFMPLTIICAIFKAYDLMTIFYLLFNGFALLSTTVIYIYKADKYDRTH